MTRTTFNVETIKALGAQMEDFEVRLSAVYERFIGGNTEPPRADRSYITSFAVEHDGVRVFWQEHWHRGGHARGDIFIPMRFIVDEQALDIHVSRRQAERAVSQRRRTFLNIIGR